MTSQNNTQSLIYDSSLKSWGPYFATIGLSTIGGSIVAGVPGGALGFALGVTNEYLIANSFYDKHYLTASTFWLTSVFNPAASFFVGAFWYTTAINPTTFRFIEIFPLHVLTIQGLSYALAAAATYSTNDFLNFKDKIEIPIESFLTLNKFFDHEQIISEKEARKIYDKFFEDPVDAGKMIIDDIQKIYNNKFLFSLTLNGGLNLVKTLSDNLFLIYLASYSGSLFISTLINNHLKDLTSLQNNFETNEISLLNKLPKLPTKFVFDAFKIVGMYIAKNVLDLAINTQKHSLIVEQFKMVISKSTDIIVDNGYGRKILADEKGKEIIDNLTFDLYHLLFSGADKLNKVISETSEVLISFENLIKYSPQAFAPYALSLIPTQLILGKIVEDTKDTSEKLSTAQTKTWEVKTDIADNIEQISLRDGEEFVKFKYSNYISLQDSLEKRLDYSGKIRTSVESIIEALEYAIDVLYFGSNFITNQLSIDHIPLIKTSVNTIYRFLSTNLYFQIENSSLLNSKKRIDKLFEIISTPSISNINRTSNHENKIIYNDYILKLDGQILVKIDHLEFIQNMHYAITGSSGGGKTSALLDLKLGVNGALTSSGEISTPLIDGTKAKIMFIDQKLYLPKDSTLLESIYFPAKLYSLSTTQIQELEAKVIDLLKELEIDGFINNLDNEIGFISRLNSTEFKLSGGQPKKIAVIQAILQKPDVLILDETFTGLDKGSLIKAQQMINKYLPNITILSVDHHAEDNNYNGFYHEALHFGNGTVTNIQIPSKSEDEIEQLDIDQSILSDNCLNPDIFSLWAISKYCPADIYS